MTKEEVIEGIKCHAEAMLNIAREIGIDDYISVGIVNGSISVSNNPRGRHLEDGLAVDMFYHDEEWSVWH